MRQQGARHRRRRVDRQGRARGVRRGVPRASALKANALYENKYPLLSAMSRPIIVKHLVEEAHRCRREVHRARLHRQGQRPGPLRGRHRRARPRHRGARAGARVGPQDARAGDGVRARRTASPCRRRRPRRTRSTTTCGAAPSSAACSRTRGSSRRRTSTRSRTTRAATRAARPSTSRSRFEAGLPVALNGERESFHEIINAMNDIAGRHGFGRIDMIENRLVGLKSREIYEVPGALDAHPGAQGARGPVPGARAAALQARRRAEVGRARLQRPVVLAAEGGARRLRRDDAEARDRRRPAALLQGQLRRRRPPQRRTRSTTTTSRPTTRPTRFDHTAAKGFIDLWGLPTQGLGAPAPQGRQGRRGLGVRIVDGAREDMTTRRRLGRPLLQAPRRVHRRVRRVAARRPADVGRGHPRLDRARPHARPRRASSRPRTRGDRGGPARGRRAISRRALRVRATPTRTSTWRSSGRCIEQDRRRRRASCTPRAPATTRSRSTRGCTRSDAAVALAGRPDALRATLLRLAEEHLGVVLPGYTHLQQRAAGAALAPPARVLLDARARRRRACGTPTTRPTACRWAAPRSRARRSRSTASASPSELGFSRGRRRTRWTPCRTATSLLDLVYACARRDGAPLAAVRGARALVAAASSAS